MRCEVCGHEPAKPRGRRRRVLCDPCQVAANRYTKVVENATEWTTNPRRHEPDDLNWDTWEGENRRTRE